MTSARKPSFFMVGAPKCGTTALFTYLRQHPQIFMPRRKEPHFFCTDLESPKYVRDEAEYLSLFADARADQQIGEASVFYLFSKVAAEQIKAFNPDAKIIIMLRDPVEMMYSLHSQRLFSGHEDIDNFVEALAAEPERREGRRLSPQARPAEVHQYRDVARYSEQVRRYIDVFGRDRVHIILHEDLAKDAAGVHAAVCAFLGLEPTKDVDFKRVNPNTRVKSAFVRDVLKFSPALKRVARMLLPRSLRQRAARRIMDWNTQVEPRKPLDRNLAEQLRQELAPDVKALERIIGRDLSAWTRSRAQ